MIRTVKVLSVKYFNKADKKVYGATVEANNEADASNLIRKSLGQPKGSIIILESEAHSRVYEMADDFFFANAKIIEEDGKPIQA